MLSLLRHNRGGAFDVANGYRVLDIDLLSGNENAFHYTVPSVPWISIPLAVTKPGPGCLPSASVCNSAFFESEIAASPHSILESRHIFLLHFEHRE
jgi:hypothetical protein